MSGVGAVAGGGLVALRAATALGAGVTTSFQMGRAASGASGLAGTAAGMGGVARAAGGKLDGVVEGNAPILQGAKGVIFAVQGCCDRGGLKRDMFKQ